MVLVLKHLAREVDIDPYKLRRILRAKYGNKGSWRWPDANKDYEAKKKFILQQKAKQHGKV